jgi:hypothetical protein
MNLNRVMASLEGIKTLKPGNRNRFAIIDRAVACRGEIIKHCTSMMFWVREIEDRLNAKGVVLKDSGTGTSWNDSRAGESNGEDKAKPSEPGGMEEIRVPDTNDLSGSPGQ